MNESPDTTGCEGMAVRPTTRPIIAMDGTLVAAFPVTRAVYDGVRRTYVPEFAVELWFRTTNPDHRSPVGTRPAPGQADDRQTFHIICRTGGQAATIAATHRSRWSLPMYGTGPCDVDGIPMGKDGLDEWVPII